MDIPITPEQWNQWNEFEYNVRPLIQNFFPELSDDHQEFLLNGITPQEWDQHIGDEPSETYADLFDWDDDKPF